MAFNAGQIVRAQDLLTFFLPGGGWDDYTPVNSNITVGNGTVDARWCQMGPVVYFSWHFELGSTSSFTGPVSVGLPTAVAASATPFTVFLARARDITANYHAITAAAVPGGTLVALQANNGGPVNATTPFTWAQGDLLTVSGWFEADIP